jgi:uncharacterized phage protein (TIGR02218 family)
VKVFPLATAQHIARGSRRLAWGIRIERNDGEVFAWTNHDEPTTVEVLGDPLYLEDNPGFDISSLVRTAGFAVDNAEFRVRAGEVITKMDILRRKWDGAKVYIFRYPVGEVSPVAMPMTRGHTGNFKPKLKEFVAEFRDFRQLLGKPITPLLSQTCRYTFGVYLEPYSLCPVDLEPLAVNGTVTTGDVDALTFTDSDRDEEDDYFGEGFIRWATGLNAGDEEKIVVHTADSGGGGSFELAFPMLSPIQVGDEYVMYPGCRKRREEDCRDKWDVVPDFGGEPDIPSRDELIRPGEHEDLG